MCKHFPALLLLLFSFFIGYAQNPPSLKKQTYELPPEAVQKLEAVSQHFVDKGLLSGSVSLIAHRDRIIYQKALGMQNLEEEEPMQLNTLFRIASMTKPLTATAAMILVEEGKLRLDDPIQLYLPEARNVKVLAGDGRLVAPNSPITIRHLLMHTSGTRSSGDPWFRNNAITPSAAKTLKEYVRLLLKGPLKFHPGEGFNYAMNNDICARIIEVVTGQNYGDFLSKNVLEPLEMNSTYFVVPEKDLDRLSSIYGLKNGERVLVQGKQAVQSVFPRGNGQLVSSARDYMNFLSMLLNQGTFKNKRLLTAESVRLLTSDQLPADIPLKVGQTVFPQAGFGLSLAISRRAARPWKPMPVKFENLFCHLPVGSYLWPGITNTFFWVDPENEITGLVFSQFTQPDKVGNFQAFTQTFYEAFFQSARADKKESMELLEASLDRIKKMTSQFSKEQIRFQPAADRWSIINNVDHLIKVEDVVWDIIQEALERPPANLHPDVSDEALMSALSTRHQRLSAPEALRPNGSGSASFEEAISTLSFKRKRTIDFLMTTREDLRAHFSKNPVFGQMDVLQWTLFLSAHCFRHIEQMEEIIAHEKFPKK